MKKVSLLILLAIVASSLMMAAIPTKMVRLTIINKSGFDVYMKLEGSSITEAYYYLTVPAGDRDVPVVKVFTIMEDVYDRTTWQCDGAKSSGTLFVDGNIRLTFTPCGEMVFSCGYYIGEGRDFRCDPVLGPVLITPAYAKWRSHYKAGEPRMEKVTYFKYLYGPRRPYWIDAYLYTGFLNWGCNTWYYRIRTYKLPAGCAFRYQY